MAKKTTPKKKTRAQVSATKGRMRAKTARGKETTKGERTGQMAAARQDALDKSVKKAGGSKKYRSGLAKTKAGMVKVGSVYTKKGSARHKAYQKKKR